MIYNTTTTQYTYNNLNQLTQRNVMWAQYNYYYDTNGNLTTKAQVAGTDCMTTYFSYDTENRLIQGQICSPTTTENYIYCAFGKRVIKTNSDCTNLYFYDGLNTLVERYKLNAWSSFSTWDVYTLTPGAVGYIISDRNYVSGTTDYFYHYDPIGNVLFITDRFGDIKTAYVQEGFGNIIASSGSSIPNEYHLTTKEREHNPYTGLYYFGARWYDPAIGRWITQEPTGIDGPNLYQYGFNNPINTFDPNGLEAKYVNGNWYHDANETNGYISAEINGALSGPISGFAWIWVNNAPAEPHPKNPNQGSQDIKTKYGDDYAKHWFCVDGDWQRADEFGNWLLGFGTGLWNLETGQAFGPGGVLGTDAVVSSIGAAYQGNELIGGWPAIIRGYGYSYKYVAKKIWSQLR